MSEAAGLQFDITAAASPTPSPIHTSSDLSFPASTPPPIPPSESTPASATMDLPVTSRPSRPRPTVVSRPRPTVVHGSYSPQSDFAHRPLPPMDLVLPKELRQDTPAQDSNISKQDTPAQDSNISKQDFTLQASREKSTSSLEVPSEENEEPTRSPKQKSPSKTKSPRTKKSPRRSPRSTRKKSRSRSRASSAGGPSDQNAPDMAGATGPSPAKMAMDARSEDGPAGSTATAGTPLRDLSDRATNSRTTPAAVAAGLSSSPSRPARLPVRLPPPLGTRGRTGSTSSNGSNGTTPKAAATPTNAASSGLSEKSSPMVGQPAESARQSPDTADAGSKANSQGNTPLQTSSRRSTSEASEPVRKNSSKKSIKRLEAIARETEALQTDLDQIQVLTLKALQSDLDQIQVSQDTSNRKLSEGFFVKPAKLESESNPLAAAAAAAAAAPQTSVPLQANTANTTWPRADAFAPSLPRAPPSLSQLLAGEKQANPAVKAAVTPRAAAAASAGAKTALGLSGNVQVAKALASPVVNVNKTVTATTPASLLQPTVRRTITTKQENIKVTPLPVSSFNRENESKPERQMSATALVPTPTKASTNPATPQKHTKAHGVPAKELNFLEKAFTGVDMVLEAIQDVDTGNPLSALLFQSALLVRNVLNCWTKGNLHDAALETCQESTSRVAGHLSAFSASAAVKLTGELEVYGRKLGEPRRKSMMAQEPKFKQGTCVAKLDEVHFMQGKSSVGTLLFDLRQVTSVQELHNGKESMFSVQLSRLGKDHLPLSLEAENEVVFKASNDEERQRWLVLFDYYRHRTKAKVGLEKLSIIDRVHFFRKNIFKPFHRNFPAKHLEFLFATDRLIDEKEQARKLQTSQRIGLKYMFRVLKSRGQGKKPHARDLEIDLSWPHKVKIWRPPEVQDEKDDPLKFDYSHADFIDWKLNRGKNSPAQPSLRTDNNAGTKVIDLAFLTLEKGKVKKAKKREYEFASAQDVTRFLSSLSLFQQLDQGNQFTFLNQGSVYLLAQSGELLHERHPSLQDPAVSTSTTGSELMSQHLHWLVCSMAESIPLNTLGAELSMQSRKLALDKQGDCARLFILNSKFEELMSVSSQLVCECEINRCRIQLLKAFYQFRGFVNVHFILIKSRGVLQQLALKVLYYASQLKHMTAGCLGRLKDLHSFQQISNSSEDSKEKFLVGSDEFDLYTRNPFAWYIEGLATHQEVTADIIQTIVDLMMNASNNNLLKTGKPLWQFEIKDPDMLPTVFAAAHSAEEGGQELCLGIIISLLTNPYSGLTNRKVFFAQRRYATWIFPFLLQEHSLRESSTDYLTAPAPVVHPSTPHKRVAASGTIRSPVYHLAVRLLRDLMFFNFTEEEVEPAADPTKSSAMYKLFMSAVEYAGGPYADVFEFHIELLKEIACRFRAEAASQKQDLTSLLWDKNVWRFLMVCEEILLYSPLPESPRTYKSKKSDVTWGPRCDPGHATSPIRAMEVVSLIMDMLCVMGQQLEMEPTFVTPSLAEQQWFEHRVKPEFAYWSAVYRLLDTANKKIHQEQIYLHQMAELAILMSDRNDMSKKLKKGKGWLPLPAYRVNTEINIGQPAPIKLDPEAVLGEKFKVALGQPIITQSAFEAHMAAFEQKLITDIKQLPDTRDRPSSVVMPSPRSLGLYQGYSSFQASQSSEDDRSMPSVPRLLSLSSMAQLSSPPATAASPTIRSDLASQPPHRLTHLHPASPSIATGALPAQPRLLSATPAAAPTPKPQDMTEVVASLGL
eukprot:g2828.t1